MKKFVLFLSILFVAVSFNSCNNDDDDNLDMIIGKWHLSQLFINNVDLQLDECDKKMTIEVFENGTYIEKDFGYNETLTECLQIDIVNGTWENTGSSMYKMSGLNTSAIKVKFEGTKMIAEYSETDEGITYLIKIIFINSADIVPDNIIGKWQLDQQFFDGTEEVLTECEKKMTIQFFDDGIYEEKDYHYEALECIALVMKKGNWKNLGNNIYEITDIDIPEVKVTFESANNKMSIEFSETENEITHTVKLIFIKVNS